jgi:hypothetical protein
MTGTTCMTAVAAAGVFTGSAVALGRVGDPRFTGHDGGVLGVIFADIDVATDEALDGFEEAAFVRIAE